MLQGKKGDLYINLIGTPAHCNTTPAAGRV